MVIPWLSNCYQFILTVVLKGLVVVHVALQVIVIGSMKRKMEQYLTTEKILCHHLQRDVYGKCPDSIYYIRCN